jgi:hypothetical protein
MPESSGEPQRSLPLSLLTQPEGRSQPTGAADNDNVIPNRVFSKAHLLLRRLESSPNENFFELELSPDDRVFFLASRL